MKVEFEYWNWTLKITNELNETKTFIIPFETYTEFNEDQVVTMLEFASKQKG